LRASLRFVSMSSPLIILKFLDLTNQSIVNINPKIVHGGKK